MHLPSLDTLRFIPTPPHQIGYKAQNVAPYGTILLAVTDQGALCRLAVLGDETAILAAWQKAWPQTRFVPLAKLRPPTSLELCGTPFQHQVWQALLAIPSGIVVTYAELATKIGQPRAARAIGNALHANPLPLLIPCHRVLRQGGKIGGYNGGATLKQRLLAQEGVTFR